MNNADELVGNPRTTTAATAFAKPNAVYLVYLPTGGTATLDLS